MNTIGTLFRFTDFGESHGPAIGGVIDGMPPGIDIDFDAINVELQRRRPGQSFVTTQRKEADEVEWLSGIFEGKTLGTPVAFIIRNTNARSEDYSNMADSYRPNHADYTYDAKYGIRDWRGGGRSSARETAARVVAGALARQVLAAKGIEIMAWTSRIGKISTDIVPASRDEVEASIVRCPDLGNSARMEKAIADARAERDSLGGIVSCVITGVPTGLGEPVFGKLQSMLASAMMSINAAKGFEYGDGFAASTMRGSRSIDPFVAEDGKIKTTSNHSGGIQGGISNGADINFNVAFKPIATMARPLPTVNRKGVNIELTVTGRHDICVVPRAVPVVEAMAAIVILDALMLSGKM